jgi:hypothetical protein
VVPVSVSVIKAAMRRLTAPAKEKFASAATWPLFRDAAKGLSEVELSAKPPFTTIAKACFFPL